MSEIRSQATPARDELAAYLDRVIDNEAWANTGDEAAKHIEEQLGWSKPHTVNSAAELDALPDGTVVRDADGTIFERSPDGEGDNPWWHADDPYYSPDEIALPATVLFTPGEAG